MLDVHPPHETPHGVGDFLLHLFTITVGLLIALSLEGIVEWHHHRHLAHSAAVSMTNEIDSNAKGMADTLKDLKKRNDELSADVDLLKIAVKGQKIPKGRHMSISFGIRTFDDVAWHTAQSTNALSYMPYDEAETFSSIYSSQDMLTQTEQTAARDTMVAIAPFLNLDDNDPDPTPEQAQAIIDKIGVLEGQFLLVHSVMTGLDAKYTAFLKTHSH